MTHIPDLNPPPRLLMGPGPVDADPRVLRAMAMSLLGQFDPAFTAYMNETMDLYRRVYQTQNRWTFLVDGTARAGIEAILTSLIAPGDAVVVPVFGRFGHLLCEIARRCRAEVHAVEADWGSVVPLEKIEAAIIAQRPKLVACVHGDTSTTMAQLMDGLAELCHRHDALLYVDATATLGGMDVAVDRWGVDAISSGLQKCLSGPPGSAPISFNDKVADAVNRRKHVEQGIRPPGLVEGNGPVIQSNYFDLAMLMEYWGERRLNHHTEATSMLYAARECARIVLEEGIAARVRRHETASLAVIAGIEAMGLNVFGERRHKMPNVTGVVIPDKVDGERVRATLLQDFGIEIGTSFGPLSGKIWRIGTMGWNCRKQNVLICLSALETSLRQQGYAAPSGAGVDAALAVYRGAGA
ncbi:MAG TPA: alanine--glyoxylate aminotransferase family protein [Alphaproteobacteria bacterium]